MDRPRATRTPLADAIALLNDGRAAEALPRFREAVAADPLDPFVLYAAGGAALAVGDHAFAARLLSMSAQLGPRNADTWSKLGTALFHLGRYDDAAGALRRALALDPAERCALFWLDRIGLMIGRRDESDACFATLDRLGVEEPIERSELSFQKIVRGRFTEGWREFASNFPDVVRSGCAPGWDRTDVPFWNGEHVPDRTVILVAAGGYGDVFLYARFLPDAARRVGRLLLDADRSTHRLIRDLPGLAGFVTKDEACAPEYADALYASMWALPAFVAATPETLSDRVPYLVAPATGPVLPPRKDGTRLRVGLVWAGNAAMRHDADRSCPSLDVLAPMFAVPGVEWVSLQLGSRAEEGSRYGLVRCPPVADFADTAHILTRLDLLITVDSAVANVAGALGLPMWVLVPTWPEFRWGLEGDTTPWFPTARLFRRRHSSEWSELAARLAATLEAHVRASASTPATPGSATDRTDSAAPTA